MMNLSNNSDILSKYKTIAIIDEEHGVFLAQNIATGKFYVKKQQTVFNLQVCEQLINHPVFGTPTIVDYCQTEDSLIIFEEYVSGTSLSELIASNNLTKADIFSFALDLCDVLSKLHAMNPPIIHRDIKPSNIIITEYNHVMLLDFNAAKQFNSNRLEDTVLLGTKGYAAPEQYGFGSSSPKTDIYSLGILLKEMTMASKEDCSAFNPIISKCTRLESSERYSSANELKSALTVLKLEMNINSGKSDISSNKTPRNIPVFNPVNDLSGSTNTVNINKSTNPPSSSRNNSKNYTPESNLSIIKDIPDWKTYLPPGFRTGKIWKMVVMIPVYIFFFAAFVNQDFNVTPKFGEYFTRAYTIFLFYAVIFATFNYRNIWNIMPLCRTKNPLLRIIGIILLDVIVFFGLFVILTLICVMFFKMNK